MKAIMAVAAVLLTAGCLGAPKSAPPPPDSAPQSQGGPPAKEKTRPPGKPNPARIFRPDREGLPYYQVKKDIEAELRDQCGGKLCVKINLKKDPKPRPDQEDCVFHRAEPESVAPGGTFTIYLSTLDCDPPPSPTE